MRTLIFLVCPLIAFGCVPEFGAPCAVDTDCAAGLACIDERCGPAEGEGEGEGEGEPQVGMIPVVEAIRADFFCEGGGDLLNLHDGGNLTLNVDNGEIRDGATVKRVAGEGLVIGEGLLAEQTFGFHIVEQAEGPGIGVFTFNRLDVDNGATVRAVGTSGRALAMLSCRESFIFGDIDISAVDGTAGAGGTDGATGDAPGFGDAIAGAGLGATSGGGGGNGGSGGDGGNGGGAGAPALVVDNGLLLGGGGGGGTAGAVGGGGGGALYIGVRFGRLNMGNGVGAGSLRLAGAGGAARVDAAVGGGGGGAGGTLVLEAEEVILDGGFVSANGGAGGTLGAAGADGDDAVAANADGADGAGDDGGSGAVGRIFIRTDTGTADVFNPISPAEGTPQFQTDRRVVVLPAD